MTIAIRPARHEDLPAVLEVEEEWPEGQRATRQQFEARLERFPQGFLLALLDGRVIGATTSCLIHYDPGAPERHRSWASVTNDGYLPAPGSIVEPNALYIVSTGIRTAYRYEGVGNDLIRAQMALSVRLGLPYATSGAIIPGYDAYCLEHGELPAAEYVFRRADGVPVDPFVRNLETLGLIVPDARHVLADYYPCPESRDWSVFVVRRNPPPS